MPLNCTLKVVKMVSFTLCVFLNILKKLGDPQIAFVLVLVATVEMKWTRLGHLEGILNKAEDWR